MRRSHAAEKEPPTETRVELKKKKKKNGKYNITNSWTLFLVLDRWLRKMQNAKKKEGGDLRPNPT